MAFKQVHKDHIVYRLKLQSRMHVESVTVRDGTVRERIEVRNPVLEIVWHADGRMITRYLDDGDEA